jgi:hypothetical protein
MIHARPAVRGDNPQFFFVRFEQARDKLQPRASRNFRTRTSFSKRAFAFGP